MNHLYKAIIIAVVEVMTGGLLASAQPIKLKKPVPAQSHIFQMGEKANPMGETLEVDSKGMLHNGNPFIPVMGEFHYARCPEKNWHDELMKIKAGGVSIVATYVFWNHHEEEKDIYDWSGRRNLRHFVEECQKAGLYVVLRVGPFSHGECRNGGFPDWLVDTGCKLRSTDPVFMNATDRWFGQIAAQVNGLLWKNGGPVIGVQVENECRGPWDYMMALKQSLVKNGFDVPLYTRTGWPQMTGKVSFGDMLPLYGDYADGFWDRAMTDMPGEYCLGFTFKPSRLSTVIASEQIKNQSVAMSAIDCTYPYFTCELGGGMMTSYHRRINIFDKDALALAICKLGSGSNLPGYYMYHGGTNPDGKLSMLNECQATKVTNWNDLPEKTYDFQAPLGEVGQVGESYPWLRRLHYFLNEFGGELSRMDAQIDSTWYSVRSNGDNGFLFVNNYVRMGDNKPRKNVEFELITIAGKQIKFPKMDIPAEASFLLPFNMKIGEATLEYATAQPMFIVRGKKNTLVMAAIKGIKPKVKWTRDSKLSNIEVRILDEKASLLAQKINLGDHDTLLFSKDVIWLEDSVLKHEHCEEAKTLNVKLQRADAGRRAVQMGSQKVAEQPCAQDFETAAEWEVEVPSIGQGTAANDVVCIDYEGDVARLYADGKLVTDNFYNGKSMWARVSELAGRKVTIKILPLYDDYPIYLQPDQRKLLHEKGKLLALKKVMLIHRNVSLLNK